MPRMGNWATGSSFTLPSNIVVNGGFETGDMTGWVNHPSLPLTVISGEVGATGTYCAKLQQSTISGESKYPWVYQEFTSNLDSVANLKIRYKVIDAESSLVTTDTGSHGMGYFRVRAFDSGGTLITDTTNGKDMIIFHAGYNAYSGAWQIQSNTVLDTWCQFPPSGATQNVKDFVIAGLATGKTWTDVAKVQFMPTAQILNGGSLGYRIDDATTL